MVTYRPEAEIRTTVKLWGGATKHAATHERIVMYLLLKHTKLA